MATYSKIPLSNSTNGKSILLTLSSAPGTLIHTTGTSTANLDEIWIYATNNSGADSLTTFYWGTTATQDLITQVNVQAYAGATVIIPGTILTGTGSVGNVVYAYAQTPSAVNIIGYVNRITA